MEGRSIQGSKRLSWAVFVISFIIVYCSQIFWPRLPSLGIGVACICAFAAIAYYTKNASAPLGASIGLIWTASVGYWYLHWQPQDIQFQQDVLIVGQITDIDHTNDNSRIHLKAKSIGDQQFWFHRGLRLNWRQPALKSKVGDWIRVTAKLKPAHGLANPFGFNYERWLLSKNIVAIGYVVTKFSTTVTPVQRAFRDNLIERLKAHHFSQQRWLLSLTFGDRKQLSSSDWELLQVSGLSHLFAISGLHLGTVAGVLWLLVGKLLTLASLLSQYLGFFKKTPQYNFNSLLLMAVAAFCVGYAYLANWQIPVIRALLMITLATLLVIFRIRINLWQLIGLAFGAFILIAPLSLYSTSFWLSIFAVGLIAFYLWRWPIERHDSKGKTTFLRYFKSLVSLQVLLSVLMLPFVVNQFGIVSIIAIVLNLIAVPFITIIIVPLCVIASALMMFNLSLDYVVFSISNYLIEQFFKLVRVVIHFELLVWENVSFSNLSLALSFVALLLAFLPRFVCQYRLVLVCSLPLIAEQVFEPRSNQQWQVHALDVGQGTGVVITQGRRAALIDTGAKFPSGFNMGEAVILPFFRGEKIRTLDHLVISHTDNDHAGSRSIIENGIDVMNRITPSTCQQGQVIEWRRLSIQVLWPTVEERKRAILSKNNLSCVVKVSDGTRSILISGDIERIAEQSLIQSLGNQARLTLASDLLVVPHHGSNTSSSLLFVDYVDPLHSIFTTGYLNRWDFPHTDVYNRYARSGSQLWDTARHGYVRVTVPYDNQSAIEVDSWRDHLYRRWYNGRTKH